MSCKRTSEQNCLRNEAAQKKLLTEWFDQQLIGPAAMCHKGSAQIQHCQHKCARPMFLFCHNCGKKGHVEWACRNKKRTHRGSKTESKKDNVKFRKKRHVQTVKSQMEKDSDPSEEGMSASVNTVWVMSVDERSDGFWIQAKLEGHSVNANRHRIKGINSVLQDIQEMHETPSAMTFKHCLQSIHWTSSAHERDDGCTGTV